MVTFFVSGFWHGAGWTFVVWGIVNGILVCIAAWMTRKGYKFPFLISFCMTFIGAVLVRVLFVSNTFTDAWNVYKGMLNFGSLGSSLYEVLQHAWGYVKGNGMNSILLVIGLFICWCLQNSKETAEKFNPSWKNAVFAAVLLTACIMQMNQVVQFLYFQF